MELNSELKLKQKQQSNKVGVDLENNIRELILKEENLKKQLAVINTKQYLDRNDSKDDNENNIHCLLVNNIVSYIVLFINFIKNLNIT